MSTIYVGTQPDDDSTLPEWVEPHQGTDPLPGVPTVPAGFVKHTVMEGDSLESLSHHYYGTPTEWQRIWNANRGSMGPLASLSYPHTIIGATLHIPQ